MKRAFFKGAGQTLVIAGIGGIAAALIISIAVSANEVEAATGISSKGNFILENGDRVAFYTDDINYLKSEIEELFNEIK